MRQILTLCFTLLVLGACAQTAYIPKENPSIELTGAVSWVGDGDTLGLTGTDGKVVTIRLSDIDAPETFHPTPTSPLSCTTPKLSNRPGQPQAQAAKLALRQLAPKGSEAKAYCFDVDKYQRQVCHVEVKQQFLHRAMLAQGLAFTTSNPSWVRDPRSALLQEKAQSQKLGLWAGGNVIHPDVWRKQCWCDGVCPGGETTLSLPK